MTKHQKEIIRVSSRSFSSPLGKETRKREQPEGLSALQEAWPFVAVELGLLPEQKFSEDPGWQQLLRAPPNSDAQPSPTESKSSVGRTPYPVSLVLLS